MRLSVSGLRVERGSGSRGTPPRRSGSRGREPARQHAEQGGVGAGRDEVDAHAGGLLHHPGADLEQSSADGGELGPGEVHPARHRIAEREHKPVGGGVEDQAELVGERALAGGAVGGELGLVLLDEVLGLSAGAIHPFVEMARLAGERGDDVARVEAAGRRLEPGNDPARAVPRSGGVIEAGEAAHLVGAGLSVAQLDVVGGLVGEGVQHRIPRQAEDVVDAVVLAPRHRLGPAVMAVAPEGQPGARPVAADAPRQMLQHGAHLDPGRRLAGAQEKRHRPAALDMVNVDREEAPRVVEAVEQRQLLMAVHRVAGLVDVERDRRRRGIEGTAEDVDQGGRQTAHLAARRRVLQTAHGGLGTQIAAALRRPAHRQLEQRVGAQVVAIVRILISAGDREHPEPQHRRERVDRPRRVAPLPDAAGQRLGQTKPALRRAQQHKPPVRRDRTAREIGGHLLAAYGWKIEREKGVFGHGGVAHSLPRG